MQDLTSSIIFVGLMFFIFYFMLIRPRKKEMQNRRQIIESVRVGDEVVTLGGLYGTVRRVEGETMELEIAPGTTVKFLKQAVARKLADEVGTTSEEGTA